MYYFVDMRDDKLNFIDNINCDTCKHVLECYDSIQEVLEFYNLGKCFADAWDQLIQWSNEANPNGNYMMRNLNSAEQLVRNFLFAFRTCLDHMETTIKRTYGKNSELWSLFDEQTGNIYDEYPEYAFTYHLRNCSQHCKNIVHGFNGNTGIGISSNAQKLISEFDKWKKVDIDFIATCGNDVDLLKIFSKTFTAFNEALTPIICYMLNKDKVGENLTYVRKWGDSLSAQFNHDVHSFHIVNITFDNGKDASREDMKLDGIVVNAYTIDWEKVYELSNSITMTTNP